MKEANEWWGKTKRQRGIERLWCLYLCIKWWELSSLPSLPGDQSVLVCLQGAANQFTPLADTNSVPSPSQQTTLTTHTVGGNSPAKKKKRYGSTLVLRDSNKDTLRNQRVKTQIDEEMKRPDTNTHFTTYRILGPSSALPVPTDTVSFNRKLSSRFGERGPFVSRTQRPLSPNGALFVRESLCCGGNKCRIKVKSNWERRKEGDGRGREREKKNKRETNLWKRF